MEAYFLSLHKIYNLYEKLDKSITKNKQNII